MSEQVTTGEHQHEHVNIWHQPMAVWAVAFACVVAFMGLGLVDPILPAIATQLHALPATVELLFTSYLLVTGIAMLITGVVSSNIGYKATLLTGLFLIVVFSALGGHAANVGQIIWFRAGWGLGNALFIATALAVIVNVAKGGTEGAIILYEAALGLGISVGPLLGGLLGGISWRGPFYGVAVLMSIGFIAISTWLRGLERPKRRSSIADPFRALGHGGLFRLGLTALLYNFGFFTLLAYTPYVLANFKVGVHGLGFIFFGWGVLLALTSVFVAPRLQERFGTLATLMGVLVCIGLDLLFIGLGLSSEIVVIVMVIVAGAFLGVNNTLITTAVMEVSPFERPVASAAYSFIRFFGGAIAPWVAGKLAAAYSPHVPYYVGAVALGLAVLVLLSGRKYLRAI
ncbi:MFS transporter [Alicyclobacillus ferrooxydans]|uniref:MFS transporter n=2 Tax=Alicyclobacillus ferrooxydans TaxID=471514 RepID=A0A0P9D8B4_9BACL|nr:MFS transporter [Alicyclobacillus ferrooxydans]KPV45543.1 MFS transporter [Alicyclobacillus ferrooxydans]